MNTHIYNEVVSGGGVLVNLFSLTNPKSQLE